MRPLQISAETAQRLAKALDIPLEQVMHLPQHILVQKLVDIERQEAKDKNK